MKYFLEVYNFIYNYFRLNVFFYANFFLSNSILWFFFLIFFFIILNNIWNIHYYISLDQGVSQLRLESNGSSCDFNFNKDIIQQISNVSDVSSCKLMCKSNFICHSYVFKLQNINYGDCFLLRNYPTKTNAIFSSGSYCGLIRKINFSAQLFRIYFIMLIQFLNNLRW